MSRKSYDGEAITVTFDLGRCVHARNCYLKLPQVFDPTRRPWVSPDAAPAEEIAATVRTCPSGALTFARKDAGGEETPPRINRVMVMENGPLSVAGDVSVEGGTAEPRLTLCRCGLSKNKPYCDYSHVEGGFQATGEPVPELPKTHTDQGGPVAASRAKDGPLKLDGNIELTTGTGRHIATLPRAFLCRCGASKNKPFCDGSHKEAGFQDDPDA